MGNEGKHDNSCMVLTYRQVGERDKHINNISKVISTNVIRARRVLRLRIERGLSGDPLRVGG